MLMASSSKQFIDFKWEARVVAFSAKRGPLIGTYVRVSSVLEPCENSCIDMSLLKVQNICCCYKIWLILQSSSATSLDAVNHGLHYNHYNHYFLTCCNSLLFARHCLPHRWITAHAQYFVGSFKVVLAKQKYLLYLYTHTPNIITICE